MGTQSARLAYADGALSSGIREAKRLLGTPAVRLTADHGLKGPDLVVDDLDQATAEIEDLGGRWLEPGNTRELEGFQ
jgi:hypothetical protein